MFLRADRVGLSLLLIYDQYVLILMFNAFKEGDIYSKLHDYVETQHNRLNTSRLLDPDQETEE